jgi:glutamine amidotransferase
MQAVIVDYGIGNIDSLKRAIEECGGVASLGREPRDLEDATHIILPGVGSFAAAMRNLENRGLAIALKEQVVANHIPLLGVCLGMQLLADGGCEGGETPGLGFIAGEIVPLKPDAPEVRIPHIGWNEVHFKQASPLFEGIDSGQDFYFVHSYHFACGEPADILAVTPYCGGFVSVVGRGTVFGTQFHPEKSQWVGFAMLRNFLKLGN